MKNVTAIIQSEIQEYDNELDKTQSNTTLFLLQVEKLYYMHAGNHSAINTVC
jgi:hypothetical protein